MRGMPDSRLRPTRRSEVAKGNITLYITEANLDVWQWAAGFGQDRGVSLSSVVAEALARLRANPPREG